MIDARLVKLVGDSAQTAIIVALVCEFIVVRKPGRKVNSAIRSISDCANDVRSDRFVSSAAASLSASLKVVNTPTAIRLASALSLVPVVFCK